MSKSSSSNFPQGLHRIGKKTDCALNRIERRKKETKTDKNNDYWKSFFSDFSHRRTTSKKPPIICTIWKNQPIIFLLSSTKPSKGLNSEMYFGFKNHSELL